MVDNKRITRDSIRNLLTTNDRAVERAMVVLYDRQTTDEKQVSDTRHSNQRGFSAAHASKGSYYARWVLGGRHLTGRHLENARKIALRYTAQLLEQAHLNAERKAAILPDQLRPGCVRGMASAYGAQCGCETCMDEAAERQAIQYAEREEREMQRMEAEGDRAQTLRDEEAKERYKAALEEADDSWSCGQNI